jgi:hypothetical protein
MAVALWSWLELYLQRITEERFIDIRSDFGLWRRYIAEQKAAGFSQPV